MAQIPDEVLYDVRLQDRFIRKGLITRKELEKRLKELDDMTDQAEELRLESSAAQASHE